jgi:flagellar biosynthesis/type III secretory pathway M-ring protein FliF/YscJ
VEIFWNYIDKYWYTDASTDEVFINAFTDTADAIMPASSKGHGIFKWILLLFVIIVAVVVIRKLVRQKKQRESEQAAEEENRRILN